MLSVPSPSLPLSEEDIDDLLYFARTDSLSDLQESLSSFSTSTSTLSPSLPPSQLLSLAVDPSTGNSALHMASANGHVEIINYILSIFPDSASSPKEKQEEEGGERESKKGLLDMQNKAGNTALHYASLNGHSPAVKALISAGADPSVQNSAGHEAAFEAERAEKAEVAEFLLGLARDRDGEGMDRGDEDKMELNGEGEKAINGEDGDEQVRELEKGIDQLSTNGTKP